MKSHVVVTRTDTIRIKRLIMNSDTRKVNRIIREAKKDGRPLSSEEQAEVASRRKRIELCKDDIQRLGITRAICGDPMLCIRANFC